MPEDELLVLHVDHRARPDSEADAAWIERECRRRGVRCRILVADRERIVRDGRASEGRLRAERYLRFAEAVREEDAAALYLAHQRDDRVEGIVLALLRGAGLPGLAGVPRRRALVRESPPSRRGPPVVRPLLDVPGAALREALRAAGTAWREDPSNDDLRFLRNRIRHVVLPWLRSELGDDLDLRLVRLARRARVLARRSPSPSVAAHRRLVEAAGVPLRGRTSRRLQEALAGALPRVFEVAPGRRLRVGAGEIVRLDGTPTPWPATAPSARRLVDRAGRAFATLEALPPKRRRAGFEARGRSWLDAARVRPPVTFRHARDGDRYRPLGRHSPIDVETLWSRGKVPREVRGTRWLAEDAEGIVAVEGLPPAVRAAVHEGTRAILRLRFRPREGR